jgi:hypothetical protein
MFSFLRSWAHIYQLPGQAAFFLLKYRLCIRISNIQNSLGRGDVFLLASLQNRTEEPYVLFPPLLRYISALPGFLFAQSSTFFSAFKYPKHAFDLLGSSAGESSKSPEHYQMFSALFFLLGTHISAPGPGRLLSAQISTLVPTFKYPKQVVDSFMFFCQQVFTIAHMN